MLEAKVLSRKVERLMAVARVACAIAVPALAIVVAVRPKLPLYLGE